MQTLILAFQPGGSDILPVCRVVLKPVCIVKSRPYSTLPHILAPNDLKQPRYRQYLAYVARGGQRTRRSHPENRRGGKRKGSLNRRPLFRNKRKAKGRREKTKTSRRRRLSLSIYSFSLLSPFPSLFVRGSSRERRRKIYLCLLEKPIFHLLIYSSRNYFYN